MNKKAKVLLVLIPIFLVLLVMTALCVERVPAGYVGVVYSANKGVEKEVLPQGWHIISPTKKVTEYSVATEQLTMDKTKKGDNSFDVICRDGKMNIDFEMSYSFDPDEVSNIYTRYRGMDGETVINTIVKGKVKTYISEVTSKYSVLEAHMEKKAELNKTITEYLKDRLFEFGVTVESANLTRTSVDPAVESAIVERSKASQELEAEKQRQEKARLEAETNLITAQGEADKKMIDAQADAEIVREKAQAEADTNKLVNDSLTDELIKYEQAKKWNGELPQVQGNASTIIDLTGEQ